MGQRRSFRTFLITFTLIFMLGMSIEVFSQVINSLRATNTSQLVVDNNANGLADGGDIIQYTVQVANCSPANIGGVNYQADIDPNTVLIPNSITVTTQNTTLCGGGGVGGGGDTNPPPVPTTTPPPTVNADAIDDAFTITNGATNTENTLTNDLGDAPITALTFGGPLLANVGDNPADGVATYTAPSGVVYTLDSTGNLTIDASALAIGASGTDTLFYAIQASNTTTDTAQITVIYGDFPTAVNDGYQVAQAGVLNDDITSNDTLGTPVATVVSFGGGSLGGTSTTPNTITPLPGYPDGSLTVNADGTFSFTAPATFVGSFTFDYTLDNGIGTSTATVTIDALVAPIANDDAGLVATVGAVTNFPVSTLFDDNGFGADVLGVPPALLVNFGGGSIVGSTLVTDFAGNATTGVGTFAGGDLTVNDNGSFSVNNPTITGSFTLLYRIQNIAGFDDASVTIIINEAPNAQDDTFDTGYTQDTTGYTISGNLTANNGAGADILGSPPATITDFGALSVTPPTNVAFAGGFITIDNAGIFTLTNATPGSYSFVYTLDNGIGTDTATVNFIVDAPIIVSSTTPTNGLNSVGLNSDVVITFSEAPTLNGGWFSIACTTSTVNTGNSALTLIGNVATINPNTDFAAGEACTVTLLSNATNGVTDADTNDEPDLLDGDNNGLTGDNYVFTFTTADSLPELTLAQVEQGGFVNVAVTNTQIANNTDIRLTFDEPVNFAGGAYSVICSISADVTADYSASATPASVVTLTYGGAGLADGDSCTVTLVTTAITDDDGLPPTQLDGNGDNIQDGSPADNEVFTFTVDIPPILLSVEAEVTDTFTIIPGAGLNNVDDDSAIRLTFSEAVNNLAGVTVTCTTGAPLTTGTDLNTAGNNSATLIITRTSGIYTGGDTCTISFTVAQITDVDAGDPPNALVPPVPATYQFTIPPSADDDFYTITPHLTFTSPTSVRANDNPTTATVTGFGNSIGTANGTAPNGTNAITAGGAQGIVIMNADGTFRFYPQAGDNNTSGTVTFFYTLNNAISAQVTLTYEVEEFVWFVDSTPTIPPFTCTAPYTGTQVCPAPDLATVDALDTANDTIFIAEGSYACLITLTTNEKIIGDGSTASIETVSGVSPVPGSSFPALSGNRPTLTSTGDCITLNNAGGNTNTLRGFNITNSTLSDVFGVNFGSLIMDDMSLTGAGIALILVNGALTADLDLLEVTSTNATAILLQGISGTLTATTTTLNNTAIPIPVVDINTSSLDANFGTTTITKGTQGNGINLTSNTAASDITFGSLAITTGNGTGLNATNHDGSITVSANTGSIAVNNGAAIDISNTAGNTSVAMQFNTISTVNSPNYGIRLDDVGGVGVTVAGNTSIDLIAGSTTGISLENVTAGAYNFSTGGTVTITDRPNEGIYLNNVDGGSVSFGNTTINNPTAATEAAVRAENGSSSVTFAQVNINQNNSGTHEGFSLDGFTPNATIGTGDALYFNTQTGGLTINGGTIQNVADDGIDIRNSTGLVLNNVTITNTGLSIGSDCVGCNSSAVQGFNLIGAVTVNNSNFTNGRIRNFFISNTAGALTFTVNNSTFDDTRTLGVGTDNLQVYLGGTSTTAIDINGGSFTRSRTNQIEVTSRDTANVTQLDITGITMNYLGGDSSGISINGLGNSNIVFNVANNPVLYSQDENVITISAGEDADVQGRVMDNPDMRFNTDSPGGSGFGVIRVLSDGATSTATVLIEDNTIVLNNGSIGIGPSVQGAGFARIDATINNNNIDAIEIPDLTPDIPFEAINGTVNNTGSNTKLLCIDVSNNTVTGIWVRALRLRHFVGFGTLDMEGLAVDVPTTWTARGNTGTPIGAAATVTAAAACNMPSNPLP